MTRLTGSAAIDYAEQHNLTLSKYADPTEPGLAGLTVEQARAVAAEDPSLVYVEVKPDARLDSLLTVLRTQEVPESQWVRLPTYGGEAPDDTSGVWSWDATRLLVGTCPEDVRIVPREES